MTKELVDVFSFDEVFNNTLREPSLFIDERYFNPDFCVEIRNRIDQQKELLLTYKNLIIKPKLAKGVNRFITGGNGLGKTATVKHFCKELIKKALDYNRNLKYIHINCKKKQTWYKLLIDIIKKFIPEFPSRGHAPTDILELLVNHLISNKMHLLIVLDDLDYLLKKDYTTLYSLIRINERSGDFCNLISIIAIVKEIPTYGDFQKEVRPYFHDKSIVFEKYSKLEIFDILNYRIKKGLKKNVISKELIEKIAKIVYNKEDIRYGLNLIWDATKLAENMKQEQITEECIKIAENNGIYISTKNWLIEMEPSKLLLLLSIINALKDNKESKVEVNEITEEYLTLCKITGLDPKSNAQIWHYLNEYKAQDLISITPKSKGIVGRKNKIAISNIPILKLESELKSILKSKGIYIKIKKNL